MNGIIEDFLAQLQPASFRGVEFYVSTSEFSSGRRIATHDFPYFDDFAYEDMGRGQRKCRFSGFLVGNDSTDVFAQRDALLSALESAGSGALVHPSLGTATAFLSTFSLIEDVKSWNYVAVSMEFLITTSAGNAGGGVSTSTTTDTSQDIDDAADDLDDSASSDFLSDINSVGSYAQFVTTSINQTVSSFVGLVTPFASDAASILNAVDGINYLFNSGFDLGRYAAGNLTSIPIAIQPLVGSSLSPTVLLTTAEAALIAADTANRQAVLASAATALASLSGGSAQVPATVQGLCESLRSAASPADAVRVLSPLASFAPTTINGTGLIQQAIAGNISTIAAACRRAALSSLGRACGQYQPSSATDAATVLSTVLPLFDNELAAASAANDSDTLAALRNLKASVIADMNGKASGLSTIITETLPTSQPLLRLAMLWYGDASQYSDLLARNNDSIPCSLFSGTTIERLS